MKGKIYKNRLTSPKNNEQLNTDISSICNPYHNQNLSSHAPLTPNSNILSPQIGQKKYQINTVFRRTSQNTKPVPAIHQLFPQSLKSKKYQNQLAQRSRSKFIDQIKYDTKKDNNSKLLKRVVSNPNLTSYQHLFAGQNRQQEQMMKEDEENILNSQSNSILYANNNSKLTQKGFNYPLINVNSPRNELKNTYSKLKPTNTNFNNFGYHQQQQANPFLQASNILNYLPDNIQNFHPSSKPSPITSDYINAYQKRHKQRIQSLQSQHQIQKQFLQDQLKQKNDLIQQMKKIIKQKQQIIKRLQSQNANISSRSYVSFAPN